MAGKTESSFGARLRRAYDLLALVQKLEDYQPPRPEESIEDFKTFVQKLEEANTRVTNLRNTYTLSVAQRASHFRGEDDSLEKIIVQIRAAVEAALGKSSTQMSIITGINRKIRATKISKAPDDPTKSTNEEAVSRSQRSYGSLTQFFSDIINSVASYPEYNPSNEKIGVTALKEKFNRMHTLNDEVMATTQDLKVAEVDRKAQFEELNARVQRIKAYIKAQYGIKSEAYMVIKGLRF